MVTNGQIKVGDKLRLVRDNEDYVTIKPKPFGEIFTVTGIVNRGVEPYVQVDATRFGKTNNYAIYTHNFEFVDVSTESEPNSTKKDELVTRIKINIGKDFVLTHRKGHGVGIAVGDTGESWNVHNPSGANIHQGWAHANPGSNAQAVKTIDDMITALQYHRALMLGEIEW
jgi:hypothetical protein